MKTIVVTGSNGFIGKNLIRRLSDYNRDKYNVIPINRYSTNSEWENAIRHSDFIIHLAGINRSKNEKDFLYGNVETTKKMCSLVSNLNISPRIFFASSIKALSNTYYGNTKIIAEKELYDLTNKNNSQISICRLPNVFGKWSKPFYNSVVATFCYLIARDKDKELEVHDESKLLALLYIDDLVDALIHWLDSPNFQISNYIKDYVESLTIGNLAKRLLEMKSSRDKGFIPSAGGGLDRKLYSTLMSFMPSNAITTKYLTQIDDRGTFSELFKHPNYGQISFLISYPGVTRGNHYHHTKVERFIILAGQAELEFRNIVDDSYFTIISSAGDGQIIETLPGYAHNIKNIGKEELIVLIWANEIFDNLNKDTHYYKINKFED